MTHRVTTATNPAISLVTVQIPTPVTVIRRATIVTRVAIWRGTVPKEEKFATHVGKVVTSAVTAKIVIELLSFDTFCYK